jgi:hypothetical protein
LPPRQTIEMSGGESTCGRLSSNQHAPRGRAVGGASVAEPKFRIHFPPAAVRTTTRA